MIHNLQNDYDDRPLSLEKPPQALATFAEYSAAERRRWLDSDNNFNSHLFDEAVELIMRKLKTLEDEGRA